MEGIAFEGTDESTIGPDVSFRINDYSFVFIDTGLNGGKKISDTF